MKLIRAIAGIALAMSWATTGHAETDGNALVQRCGAFVAIKDTNSPAAIMAEAGYCAGMVNGVSQSSQIHRSAGGSRLVCLPLDEQTGGIAVLTSQLVRVVMKYLADNPAKLHYPDTALVMNALTDAYPCPTTDPSPRK